MFPVVHILELQYLEELKLLGLRGSTTGYAIPQFVTDAPGGGGKIPINPDYVERINNGIWYLKNFKGKLLNINLMKNNFNLSQLALPRIRIHYFRPSLP